MVNIFSGKNASQLVDEQGEADEVGADFEVAEGYKQTELGILPTDWKVETIGDFDPFVTSGSRGWGKFYSKNGSPFIRITNMTRGDINLDVSKLRFVDVPLNNKEGQRTELWPGDILVSITADIGIISYVTDALSRPAFINQHIALVRFKSEDIDSHYLSYSLLKEETQNWFESITDQGAKAGINLNTIRKILVPLPPTLEEQEAIAEALSDVDGVIGGLEKLIAKKRDIKTATMQQLLTGKTRLPGFGEGKGTRQTELGEIPEDWEVKTLGELTHDIRDGTHQTPKYVDNGVPFYSVEHVTGGNFSDTKFISQAEHKFLTKSFRIERGDILMTRIGSIGVCKLVDWDVDASFYVSLALLKVKKKETAQFICQASESNSFISEIDLHSLPSATPKKINLGPLADVRLNIPTNPEEQKAIAKILSDMDDELIQLTQKLDKTKALKQGMMQQLLTGKVRLV